MNNEVDVLIGTLSADGSLKGELSPSTIGSGGGGEDEALQLFVGKEGQELVINAKEDIEPAYSKGVFYGFGKGANSSLTLNGFTTIYMAALYSNQGLAELYLPDVVTIAGMAFQGSVLRVLDIGENCTSIGADALKGCAMLADIYVRAKTVPTLSSTMSVSVKRIHVRASLLEQYQAADGWSNYSSKLVGDIED